jgi:SAM-dependent methyltransferase
MTLAGLRYRLSAMRRRGQRALEDWRDGGYARRLREEAERFAQVHDVNDLPPIFHYWSNRYLRPMLETFGATHPEDFFARAIANIPADRAPLEILSVGAGNGDTELRLAALLLARGVDAFEITCLDLVPAMLDRSAERARAAGLERHFRFECADFNRWDGGADRYDVVIANQCLHHVVRLETLLDGIVRWLRPRGCLLISDLIGRNGHQRWPEARRRIDALWQELPMPYRLNRQLQRLERDFLDWDCAQVGFEGIRSQDILPLLIERFGFRQFIAFGWNFDANADWDRAFIDRVHALDEAAIDAREITPTHVIAQLTLDRSAVPQTIRQRTPLACVRRV